MLFPTSKMTNTSLENSDDPDTGDIYSGLDRFGRIKDCRWRNTDSDTDLSRIQYGYDRASNRIWRKNPTDPDQHYDWLYSYDGLQRLKDGERGTLNGTHDGITNPQFAQCWTLDETGNWQGFRQSDNGSDWSLVQARTANTINEITGINASTGPAWATPGYDQNGNMTTIPRPDAALGPSWSKLSTGGWGGLTADGWGTMTVDPSTFTATYDAWNRLVKVTGAEGTVQEDQYDARNFRIVRKEYTGGALSETRHYYYTDGWQDVEERVGDSTDANQQNVWGVRYIDDLILRDRDTNSDGTLNERFYACQDATWNTTAIVDTSGDVQERYEYDPYGVPTFLSPTFNERPSSSYKWETLFTGRYYDAETALYNFRMRMYASVLGVFLICDPSGYVDGTNRYAAYFPLNGTDPTGNEKIWFEFNAFIPASDGVAFPDDASNKQGNKTWIYALGWYYLTDNRSFGGGTSRVFQRAWIDSEKLGRVGSGDWGYYYNTSGSFRVKTSSQEKPERMDSQVTGSGKVFNSEGGTTVRLKASGGDPFIEPFAPNVDFEVDFNFDFDRCRPNEVKVSVNGWRNSSPNYEAIVTTTPSNLKSPIIGQLLYKGTGSSTGVWSLLYGLNSSVLFGTKPITIQARTPQYG